MGKTVIKDTFREIKGSFGRFFAIFAIVAIGVVLRMMILRQFVKLMA